MVKESDKWYACMQETKSWMDRKAAAIARYENLINEENSIKEQAMGYLMKIGDLLVNKLDSACQKVGYALENWGNAYYSSENNYNIISDAYNNIIDVKKTDYDTIKDEVMKNIIGVADKKIKDYNVKIVELTEEIGELERKYRRYEDSYYRAIGVGN